MNSTKINKLIKRISYCFFPNRCAACNKLLTADVEICPKCKVFLRRVPEHISEGWAHCSGFRIDHRQKLYFDGIIAPFYYVDTAKDVICNYKIIGRSELSEFLANEMLSVFYRHYGEIDFDILCGVPMTNSDKLKKGFDHIGKLCRRISYETEIPYENVLKQIKSKRPQHTLSMRERFQNVKGIYAVRNRINLKGKTVLLIDDIVTTSASINECSKIIKRAGAEKVYCLSAAKR